MACLFINPMAKLRGVGRRKNKCSGSADQGYGWWQWRYGKGYKPEKATSVIYTHAATVAPLYAFHSFLSLQYRSANSHQLNSPRAISGSRPLRAPTRPAEVSAVDGIAAGKTDDNSCQDSCVAGESNLV